MYAIGVDIGGTKIAAGVVDQHGAVIARLKSDTAADQPDVIEHQVVGMVNRLRGQFEVTTVGVAAAGFVSHDRSTVMFAPNIAWRQHPLGHRLSDALNLPVAVENDANAAGWAEFRFGAGRHTTDMITVTIGTGVGGAIIMNSQLARGARGTAAEVGHITMVPQGHPCGCGNRGCWEQYASGRALTRDARAAAHADPARARGLLAAAGGHPDHIDGSHVTQLAGIGDPLAVDLLAGLGTRIGVGAAMLATALDPAVIVLGGGVAAAGDLLLQPARAALADSLPPGAGAVPALVPAEMDNDAGIVGAADLAREGLCDPPLAPASRSPLTEPT